MSRIGKAPITLPKGVDINISNGNLVTVKGPKGTLTQQVDPELSITIENGVLVVTRPTEQKRHRAMHGLYRALINNMVFGVTEGYTVKQELVGVGYKATNDGNILDLTLGFSHHIYFQVPMELKVKTETE